MADQRTLDHYRDHLATYLDLYRSISVPRLESLILSFFHEGGRTLDIGCASGRDLTTLLSHGFRAEGLDAVEGFVEACRARHPDTPIHQATLPDLAELLNPDQAPHFEARYDNLLVSAVLMHLPSTKLQRALSQLKRLLREGGRALISVRASRATDTPREGDRLFSPITSSELTLLCEHLGLRAIYSETRQEPDEAQGDETRSGKRWVTLVVERVASEDRRGLEAVQSILLHDKKTSSYKFALLRALSSLARERPFSVVYDLNGSLVWAPMTLIAQRWVIYYWGLCHPTLATPIRQQTNKSRVIKVARHLAPLFEAHPILDVSLAELSEQLLSCAEDPEPNCIYDRALREISHTIRLMPVTYITNQEGEQTFKFHKGAPHDPKITQAEAPTEARALWRYGAIGIPTHIWFDLRRFWHWVEDSLLMRWAEFTRDLNGIGLEQSLDHLTLSLRDEERSTKLIRDLWIDRAPTCVWSGAELKRFDVDHLIPYSIRGHNELWNLFPSSESLNRSKNDAVPTLALLESSRARVISAWEYHYSHLGERFEREVRLGLGVDLATQPLKRGLAIAFDRLTLLIAGYLAHAQARGWEGS